MSVLMRRPRRFSHLHCCARLLLAALTGFWTPAAALLHGYAHAHEALHASSETALRASTDLRQSDGRHTVVRAAVGEAGVVRLAEASRVDADHDPAAAHLNAHDDDEHWHPALHQQLRATRSADAESIVPTPIAALTITLFAEADRRAGVAPTLRISPSAPQPQSRPRAPPVV